MLTERMQKRILYHLFSNPDHREYDTGDLEGIDPDPFDFNEPWQSIYLRAERAEIFIHGASALYLAVQGVAEDEEDRRRIMNEIDAAAAPMYYPTMEEIRGDLPPVSWLWHGWIPRGMLSILGSYQGTGKSYFVMDLTRAVVSGDHWPCGAPVRKPGSVIYIDAESIPQVNTERAKKLGVDMDKVFLVYDKNYELMDFNETRWQHRLWDMISDIQPELVIIDSFSSISTKGQNTVEDTREILKFLVHLAVHGDCGMLLLHHLRKPPANQLASVGVSMHDFKGSTHIPEMGRTVFGLSIQQAPGRPFDLDGQRFLNMCKTNLDVKTSSMNVNLIINDDAARFEYEEATAFNDSAQNDCQLWLLDFLEENGATKSSAVYAAGKGAGFDRMAIYHARKKLTHQIGDSEQNRNSPKNKWRLLDEMDDDDK